MNKKNDRIEATLLTFKMVLDAKGNLWTDIGGLPLKKDKSDKKAKPKKKGKAKAKKSK